EKTARRQPPEVKMSLRSHATALLAATALACVAIPSLALASAMTDLTDYLHNQNSTGFLVIEDGKTLVEKNWPAPEGDKQFSLFVYGKTKEGALLEDVASQQKSFVSVLVAVAIDKQLIDVDKPVSAYIGAGWSKAAPEQEAKIRVIDVLTMSSGLNDG